MDIIKILSNKISVRNQNGGFDRLPLSVIRFCCDDDIARKINSGLFKKLYIEVCSVEIHPFEKEIAGVLHLDNEIKVIDGSKHNEKAFVTLEII